MHAVGIGKDLNELIVGDEIKPGEQLTFDLQVILKFFLYFFQEFKILSEVRDIGILE